MVRIVLAVLLVVGPGQVPGIFNFLARYRIPLVGNAARLMPCTATRCMTQHGYSIYLWPWFPRWQAIDICAELRAHWEHCDGLPPDLDHRLRAYLLHIGLDAMTYNAFRGRWDDLTRNTAQVAQLINELGQAFAWRPLPYQINAPIACDQHMPRSGGVPGVLE